MRTSSVISFQSSDLPIFIRSKLLQALSSQGGKPWIRVNTVLSNRIPACWPIVNSIANEPEIDYYGAVIAVFEEVKQ